MFKGLRLRLTLLYTLAALALVALVGGGAYLIVTNYFSAVTDLALQHKMAHEFHALAAPLPPELAPADRDWSVLRGELGLLPPALTEDEDEREDRLEDERKAQERAERERQREEEEREEEEDEDEDEEEAEAAPATPSPVAPSDAELAFDAELAAIAVLPLDTAGNVLFEASAATALLAPDQAALSAALVAGRDLRTVTTADGRRVRLLTYRLTRPDGPAALQLGRELGDQERVLAQLTAGLLFLGALSMILVGIASWWLAGRALVPAEQAWERQQRFIASASHELRTPLTLIRASAEVAQRALPADELDQRALIGDVLAESDHMRRLVDDLLMLSRLDSGAVPARLAPVELAPLMADVQRQVARLGDERGVAVTLGEVVGTATADPERLRQVLLILLDNGLRHTPAGGRIVLGAQPQGRAVLLRVADSGCGIAPEHLPHIFERFYRVDPARGRESGNAGLGLSIARGLVEAMGGQIGAESAPGQGTTIWIKLPLDD